MNKTWQPIEFNQSIFPRNKKRIIGLTFPECDVKLGLEPSVLHVLPPDGDSFKSEYSMKNTLFNDDDVMYYLCSVYISGMEEFEKWASQHDKTKIVVGGYHPTTFPEEFKNLAYKIVQGTCDDFFATITQRGQVVKGITSDRVPRYELYNIKYNHQIIPDAYPGDIFSSIVTSQGCPYKCDFCCSPIMCDKLVSRPLHIMEAELTLRKQINPTIDFMFIRDENFPLQKDWKLRLEMIHRFYPETKVYMFASANLLTEEMVGGMKDNNVYMVCIGLENINSTYAKNKNLDVSVQLLKKYGIYTYLSFIVNPLEIIGREKGELFYAKLNSRLYELMPEMICGNFLMPFKGTKLWDEYYWLVSKDDFKEYDSKSAFLIKNEIIRKKMEFYMFWNQYSYYNSSEYLKMRNFNCGDTLNQRFNDLFDKFKDIYERNWNKRG